MYIPYRLVVRAGAAGPIRSSNTARPRVSRMTNAVTAVVTAAHSQVFETLPSLPMKQRANASSPENFLIVKGLTRDPKALR